jgi:hypothetical protein
MMPRRELLFVALHRDGAKFIPYLNDARFAKVSINSQSTFSSGQMATVDRVLLDLAAEINEVKPTLLTLVLEWNLGFSSHDVSPLPYIREWLANYPDLKFEIVLNPVAENKAEAEAKIPVKMVFSGGGGSSLVNDPEVMAKLMPMNREQIPEHSFNGYKSYLSYISSLRAKSPSSQIRSLSGSSSGSSDSLSGLNRHNSLSSISTSKLSSSPTGSPVPLSSPEPMASPIFLPSAISLTNQSSDKTPDRLSIASIMAEVDAEFRARASSSINIHSFFDSVNLQRQNSAPVASPPRPSKLSDTAIEAEKKEGERKGILASMQTLDFTIEEAEENLHVSTPPAAEEEAYNYNPLKRSLS